jgi:hypothetical protein
MMNSSAIVAVDDIPLRLSLDRVRLYGTALAIIGCAPLLRVYPGDWPTFWFAGATVGTSALIDPRARAAFQLAHNLNLAPWVYPPAFAWIYFPFAHMSIAAGYAIDVVLMLLTTVAAGWTLSNLFAMNRTFAVIASLAWIPATNAAGSGQNAPLALLLIVLAVAGVVKRSPILLGVAVGLLLYKPTDAIPFIVLLLLRRKWRALFVVGICALCWYFGSVAAAAGDWAWISHTTAAIEQYYARDFGANSSKSLSLPAILMQLGVSKTIAIAAGLLLLLLAIPKLSQSDEFQTISMTPLLTLAVSPHAWPYDAAIALPALFYAMRFLAEPLRTPLVIGCYIVAASWIFVTSLGGWDPLAVVTLGGTACWLFAGKRPRKDMSWPCTRQSVGNLIKRQRASSAMAGRDENR